MNNLAENFSFQWLADEKQRNLVLANIAGSSNRGRALFEGWSESQETLIDRAEEEWARFPGRWFIGVKGRLANLAEYDALDPERYEQAHQIKEQVRYHLGRDGKEEGRDFRFDLTQSCDLVLTLGDTVITYIWE